MLYLKWKWRKSFINEVERNRKFFESTIISWQEKLSIDFLRNSPLQILSNAWNEYLIHSLMFVSYNGSLLLYKLDGQKMSHEMAISDNNSKNIERFRKS